MANRKRKPKVRPVRPQPKPIDKAPVAAASGEERLIADMARDAVREGDQGGNVNGSNAFAGAEEQRTHREEPHRVRTIVVTETYPRQFDVQVDGRIVDRLGFDEALGVLSCLLVPSGAPIRLPMMTVDDHREAAEQAGRRRERNERTMQVNAFNEQMQNNTAIEIEVRRRVDAELARIDEERKKAAAAKAGKASARARRRARASK